MKKGDIVRYIGNVSGDKSLTQYIPYRPTFLRDAIGKIMDKVNWKSITPMTKISHKKFSFLVTFLFEVNVEKRYISSFDGSFNNYELQLATDEEKKRYYELEDIIKAKEIAEKL